MPQPPNDDPESGEQGAKRTIAVALKYDRHPEHAPRVVASGRGAVADSILERAFAHGVKVREDADLAALLSAVEVGDEIPLKAFIAVAELLAHIYQANGTMPDFEKEQE